MNTPTNNPTPDPTETRYRVAVRCAAVAGVFSLIVCALLLYDFRLRMAADPYEEASFKALKLALAQQPDDEQLQAEIRALDRQLRLDYFRRRVFAENGAWLLLGGMVVFLITAKWAATLHREIPMPEPQAAPEDRETQWTRVGRYAVAGLGLTLVATTLALSFGLKSELPETDEDLATLLTDEQPQQDPAPVVEIPPAPSAEQYAKMWPRFRGPVGSGVSAYTNIPTTFDVNTGEGILWKTPVPLPGFNSPVVWKDRVLLAGATAERQEVYCFDATSGKLLWTEQVTGTPGKAPNPQFTGFAAPTMATDGRYAFASFATGDLAALDLSGKQVWKKSLGTPENSYGHSTSLATYQDLLLVQFDQGSRRAKKSKLFAFDMHTGDTVWQVDREVSVSWTTPIVITHHGQDQVITCSDPDVIAYDPTDGKELWRVKCTQGECGPSPVYHAGTVHVGNEYCVASAIRLGTETEPNQTEILWEAEDGLPDTCSPLVTDEFVFLLPATGYFTCLDVKTGEMLWELEFEAEFNSSPSLVGNRIYLFGEIDKEDEVDEEGRPAKNGKLWVVEFNREAGHITAESELGEGCVASPAFQDGRMYIRGKKHLFCIGQQ